jgi:hypothetical protein
MILCVFISDGPDRDSEDVDSFIVQLYVQASVGPTWQWASMGRLDWRVVFCKLLIYACIFHPSFSWRTKSLEER